MTSYQSNRNGLRLVLPPGVDPSSFATPAASKPRRIIQPTVPDDEPTPTPTPTVPDDEPTSTASPEEF